MNLNNIFNKSKFNQYAAYLKSTGISSVSIKRKLSSLSTFEKFLIKKKLISPSQVIFSPKENFLKKIFSSSVTKYQTINNKFKFYLTVSGFAVVILALGFGLYTQTFLQAKQKLAFSTAASPVVPTRQFSFQGRLTDSSGNPITSSTQIEFKLYDVGTTGTGTLLYDSFTDYGSGIGSTVVTPDSNGIFSVIIGKTHGSEIPATVFSQNKEVWLEITAGGEVLNPRQQIATVAYALNSETLQGLPPSASGLKNTLLVFDSSGNINLGETSPTIRSTSGTLGIEGQSLLIKASDSSGGNIEINPDANGIIKLTTEGVGPSGASGFISATNANLTTGDLFSGEINNTNRGYNFLEFKNFDIGTSSLQTRFSVSAYGNVDVGATLNSTNISIGNTLVSSSANELNLLDGLASTNGSIIYANGSNLVNLNAGTSGYLLQTNGANQAPTWLDPSSLVSGNTNASQLQSATWGAPLAIGSTTANTGNFTTLSATSFGVGSSFSIDSNGNASAQKFSDIANSNYFLTPANSDPNKNSLSLYETGSIKFNVGTSEFLVNGIASRIQNFSNGLLLGVSPSGSAGSAISGWDNNLFIGSTGFVGIGTTNPTKKLDIAGDLKLSGTVFVGTGTTGASGQVLSSNGSGGLSWVTAAGSTYTAGNGLTLVGTNFKIGGDLGVNTRFNIGSTEVMYFDFATGKVGIGTTETVSTVKLAVSGGGILLDNNQSLRSRDSVGTARNMLFWDSNEIVHLRNNDNATGGAIAFESKPSARETMRLTTDGFVGIGTTNPLYMLDVSGNVNVGSTAIFNSNIGIGTSVPQTNLHIYSSQNIPQLIIERSNSSGAGMQFKNTTDPIGYFIGMSSTEKFGIGKTGDLSIPSNNFMTIDSVGNIGIGTTNPISPISLAQALGNKIDLWQNGTTRYGFGIQSNLLQTYVPGSTNDFAWGTGNSTSFSELMRLKGDGKLGIGTSNPLYSLDITGDANITTSLNLGTNLSIGDTVIATATKRFRADIGLISSVSYGASGDGNTGLYFPALANLGIATSGVEAIRIDQNGQIGIGTTTPGSTLHVFTSAPPGIILERSTGGNASMQFKNTDDPIGYFIGMSETEKFGIGKTGMLNTSNFLTIDNTGKIGIGTTNPLYLLDINGNLNVGATLSVTGRSILTAGFTSNADSSVDGTLNITGTNSLQIGSTDVITSGRKFRSSTGTVTNNSFSLSTDTTTGIYFPSAGNLGIAVSGMDAIKIGFSGSNVNVGIGTSSNPLYVLDVVGVGGTIARFINSANQSCIFNGGLISCSSDIRLKKNVENISYGLSNLMDLRPVDFIWKSDGDNSSKNLGFIAQEVESLIPELVSEDPGTGYKQLNSLGLIPILTKSIQEQQAQINDLSAKALASADLSITQEGQIFINDNISDQVLSSLGYNNAKNEIENAKYSLTDSTGNIVNKIGQFNKIISAKIETGFLAAKNLVAKNIAVENLFAKRSTIDNLRSNIISPLADDPSHTINISGNASVSGTLTSTEINSKQSTIDNLRSNTATISTLYADNIISKQGSFADLMSNKISSLRDEFKKIVDSNLATGTSTPSINQNLADQSKTWSADIASDSAKITGDLALTDSLIIGAKLTVIGDTQLGNAFINGTFTAGEIAIKNNIIETANTALYIQPSGTGSVNILNNTFIAENGNVTINGNLNLNGSLIAHSAAITSMSAATASVSGSLIANMIKTSEVQTDKINVSTDSAQLIIAQSNTPEIASTSAQFSTNATAGTITLPAGKTELIISNNKISANSMVYLTPVGSTNNQVVYVKNKNINSFTISIDNPLEKDIQINWWIIN